MVNYFWMIFFQTAIISLLLFSHSIKEKEKKREFFFLLFFQIKCGLLVYDLQKFKLHNALIIVYAA